MGRELTDVEKDFKKKAETFIQCCRNSANENRADIFIIKRTPREIAFVVRAMFIEEEYSLWLDHKDVVNFSDII